MIIDVEEVRILKEIIVISFKALFCHSIGVIEKNHEEMSEYPITGLCMKMEKIRFSKMSGCVHGVTTQKPVHFIETHCSS
jgi:hypothetical protein